MTRVNIVLDDVVLALKNKQKIAKERTRLTIPKLVSETGKTRNVVIDVSSEGKKLLADAHEAKDKLIQKAEADHAQALEDAKKIYDKALQNAELEFEKQKKDAWKNLNKIATKVKDTRGSSSKTQEDSSESEHVSDNNVGNDANVEVKKEEHTFAQPEVMHENSYHHESPQESHYSEGEQHHQPETQPEAQPAAYQNDNPQYPHWN